MYTTRQLSEAELPQHAEMTFPRFRNRLGQPGLVGVGAMEKGQVLGLALAELPPDRFESEVLSVFVAPEHRGKGIGSALMKALEDALLTQGVKHGALSFASGKPTTEAFEAVLRRRGWGMPQPRMYLARTNRKVLEAPWTQRELPPPFTLFPWSELTAEERATILRRQAEGPWFPPTLTPFQDEPLVDLTSSVGMRREGEVLGWMVTHRVGQGTLRYSSLFVDEGVRVKGCGVSVCGAAVRRQDWELHPYALFAVMVDNARMLDAMRRNIAPYLISLSETRRSWKELGKD